TPAAPTRVQARHPRPASSVPAPKRLWRPRSKANRRRLRASLRRPVRDLEGADAVGWPVGGKGLADDPFLGDGSPEAAVVTCATVVAHHEVVVGRDLDRLRHVAGGGAAAGDDVRLVGLLDAVDDGVAILDRERVARPGDDPLDEVLLRLAFGRLRARFARFRLDAAFGAVVGAGGWVEDDDVAERGIVQVVDEAVD